MADEKDKKEKTDSKESKAAEAKAEKPAKKAAAKKESKPAAKKDAEKKESAKDSGDKPAKKESAKKAAPKADKKEAKGKEDKDEKPAKKPRKRAKKADAKAEEKKPAPSRRRRRGADSDELPVVRASAKYVRVAPRKARLIADQVRGLHIEKARALLAFSPRGAAQDISKLIDSAAANAENNHDLIGDEMKITSITVDEGPTLRRFRPRALGRATPINKRTSHIAVALTPVEDD
jgi:ribosomal protein L22